jgi:hypothetical protein
MTSLVAIMNKRAVALAADSAVTTSGYRGTKIFYSVNKLFRLTKYHPVGIMIFGQAQLMEVPWETIIKLYRRQIKKKSFPKLEDYATDFIDFLKRSEFYSEDSSKRLFERQVFHFINHLISESEKKINEIIDSEGDIRGEKIKEFFAEFINDFHKNYALVEANPNLPDDFGEKIFSTNKTFLNDVINELTEKYDLSPNAIDQLKELFKYLFIKKIVIPIRTGVVIAGFGQADIFPSLIAFNTDGYLEKTFIYYITDTENISYEDGSKLLPFAQNKQIYTFLTGIDPDFHIEIVNYLSKFFSKYPQIISENLDIKDEQKIKLLEQVTKNELDNLFNAMLKYQQKHHIYPILNVVSVLPIDDLAKMAESLINITCFRKRISTDEQSVGEPIDVAVISKGDGFIWIKRKHYFDMKFNPQFPDIYYLDCEEKEESNDGKYE